MSDQIVYGVRVEEDIKPKYIMDDISDQLGKDGFSEDDWDFLAWELHGVFYMVFYGSYLMRASILKVEYVERIEPLLEVTSTIKSNKAKWIWPSRKRDGVTPSQEANKRLDQWMKGQFPHDNDDQKAIDQILASSEGVVKSTRVMTRRRGGASTSANAGVGQGAVKGVLGVISQGKSEDGEKFEVFSFDDKAPTG